MPSAVAWPALPIHCSCVFFSCCFSFNISELNHHFWHGWLDKNGEIWDTCTKVLHNREKSLTSRCHGSKISGWHQTQKCHWLIDLIQVQLFCQMLAKFAGVKSKRTIFKFRKRKENCVAFTYFIKWVHEIRKFHVSSAMTAKKWTKKCDTKLMFFYLNLSLLSFSLLSPSLLLNVPIVVIQNFATVVMWCHTFPLYYQTVVVQNLCDYVCRVHPRRRVPQRDTRWDDETKMVIPLWPKKP